MKKVYIGTTFEAEYSYPSGLDNTYIYQAGAASPTTQIASSVLNVEAEADTLKVSADAVDTAKWKAGEYTLQIQATGADATVLVRSIDTICVVPSVFSSGAKAIDPSSTAQKPKTQMQRILDAAWKALETASGNSAISVSVDSFSETFENRRSLLLFINDMERLVKAEQGQGHGGIQFIGVGL